MTLGRVPVQHQLRECGCVFGKTLNDVPESGHEDWLPSIPIHLIKSSTPGQKDVDSSTTTLVTEQPLLESTIPNHMTQPQEYTDTNCTEAVTSFQDGQEVELDDGSTAYIFHQPKDNYPEELIQPVQVNGVMTAYIYRPNQESLPEVLQPSTSKSDDEEPMRLPIQTQTNIEIKEIKSRPPQTFQCDRANCKKFYSSAHHLKVHKRSHTGEKPYVCCWENCKKVFTTSYALKSHLRVHTGEKPYRCPLPPCKKAFKTSGDLHKHIRTHTGEKPFKCPFEGCGKAFTTSNICKVHIRTHTGERPHKCPFSDCPKSFANITNYKNHVRIHTGEKPYVCMVGNCGKQFTEYSSLYKHQIVHSVDKPYSCPHCDKMYRQVSTLILHKKKSHKGMDDKDFPTINAKHSIASTYNSNTLNSKLHADQASHSNKSDSRKTSSVVVVPVKAMTSSCIVMNSAIDNQFLGLPTQEDQSQLKFVTGNGSPEPVMVSVETDNNVINNTRVEFQTSAKKTNEEALYINKEINSKNDATAESYSSVVLPTAVVAAESSQESGNTATSELWMKMNFADSSVSQEAEKQTDQQFQVATLEINGTKYLVQVYDDSISGSNVSNIPPTPQGTNVTDNALPVSDCALPSSDHNSYFVSSNQVPTPVDSLVPQTVLVGNIANESPLTSRNGLQILQMPISKPISQQVTQPSVQQTKKLFTSSKATNLVPILPAGKQRITVKLPRKIRPALHKSQPTTLKRIVPKLKGKSP